MKQYHGGKRPGAGRPPKLAVAYKDNVSLATQLKHVANIELEQTVKNYPALVKLGIEAALSGDKNLLKYFLELPFKYMMPVDVVPDSAMAKMREKWSHSIEVEGEVGREKEDPDKRYIEDAGHQTLA